MTELNIKTPITNYASAGVIMRIGDGNTKEILMLQRSKNDPLWPLQWEFPRGTCEPGIDKTLRECMTREIKEETGLDVKVLDFIDKHKYVKDGGEQVTYCYNYSCKLLDPNQDIRLSREHDSYKWISEVGEVELMATPEQKKTIQKVLNTERAIVSNPKMKKIEESNLDFYLTALQEDPITVGGALMTAGNVLLKVYIGAMLIKLAKDVFKLNFTKLGRQCKDYPGGERAICIMRAKMQAKKAEIAKLKDGIEKCGKDKDPEACRRKVKGRMDAIQKEVSFMERRLGELRRAPIVH
jgi:8-oxo-dGTP pyrophosphatase MutT (NUDIX family)